MDTGPLVMMMTARFSRRNAASSGKRVALGLTALSHKSLLDLLVRTDTKGVGRGFRGSAGPLVPACRVCGWPMTACVCQD